MSGLLGAMASTALALVYWELRAKLARTRQAALEDKVSALPQDITDHIAKATNGRVLDRRHVDPQDGAKTTGGTRPPTVPGTPGAREA